MKKTRKLIPAIAMLLISAVMMSTASFAWFTMNDEVTATGMQLQAKASGSLIIDTQPLKWNSSKTTVSVDNGVQKLRPMTYQNGWKIPDGSIDYSTGKFEGEAKYKDVPSNDLGEYYVEQTFYIGAAGDALNDQEFTMTLTAPVVPATDTSKAYYAYSVLLYVCPVNADGTYPELATLTPSVLSIDNTTTNGNDVVVSGVDIPSIVGVGAQDNKTTGLKIVAYFFVDGDLDAKDQTSGNALTKPVVVGYEYAAATGTVNANTTYYVLKTGTLNAENATYETVIIPEGTTTVGANWLTRTLKSENQPYKYVNSAEVPTMGATLEVSFSAVNP